ncbi:hypothetical protein [Stappia sp.]|uniref:DUF4870 family protein n=1 Tax=Stappia sp. TaxID=1870903 RepID=UPI0032D90F4E
MSEGDERGAGAQGYLETGPANVQLIYVLYLVGLAFGLTALIGVVLAYMNRGAASGVLASHYTYLVRTFWLALGYGLVAAVLMVVGIGFLLMIAVAVWLILRCLRGLQWIGRGEPVPDPRSFLI